MLLVYTHKITPRVTYIFKHVFENMLGHKIGFTTAVDVFVAHSGPKLSYTRTRLGDEFFIASHALLFEQGVQSQTIEMDSWEGLPIFFKTQEEGPCPYDFFAASFYLMSRYEEAVPHLKNAAGHFDPRESLACQHDFLERPVVDLWVAHFSTIVKAYFEEFNLNKTSKPQKEILIEVPLAFQYRHQSPLVALGDFFKSLWKLNLRALATQLSVLFRLQPDPYDSFDSWNDWFPQSSLRPKVFFLFAKSSAFQSTISIFNLSFRKRIKQVSDFFPLGVLASVKAQRFPDQQLTREKNDLQALTHRVLSSIRLSDSLQELSKEYSAFINAEFVSDYSMGYKDRLGYRAGTATPFFFYDISNEFQLPLKVHPIFASEEALRKMNEITAFEKIKVYSNALPLASGKFTLVLTNGFLHPSLKNNTFQKGFQDYIRDT